MDQLIRKRTIIPATSTMFVVPAGAGCPTATTFLARTSGLDSAHQMAYTTLICGLVSDGIWPLLDALYIFATADSTTALLNLVSTSYSPTGINGTPTFAVDAGFTGAFIGSIYFRSNFVPSTSGSTNYLLNSAMFGFWCNTSAAAAAAPMGGEVGSDEQQNHLYNRFSTDEVIYALNGTTTYTDRSANADGKGWYNVQRDDALNDSFWKNGSFVISAGNAAGALPTSSLAICGSGGNGTDQQIMAAVIGGKLTVGQHSALYSRVHTYLQTIAGIP